MTMKIDLQSIKCVNPFLMAKEFWPDVVFYKQQREIIQSVFDNRETVVVAANMLGKDFIAGFIVLWFFLTRQPCRVVVTSAKDRHLNVLWGEIGRFIRSSVHPLEYDPKHGINTGLILNDREIKRVVDGDVEKESYIMAMVTSNVSEESMQGHHSNPSGKQVNRFRDTYNASEEMVQEFIRMPRSLFVADEASSLPDSYYTMADTWAQRMLIFGNPWPCANFFKRAVKGNPKTKDRGGDLPWA